MAGSGIFIFIPQFPCRKGETGAENGAPAPGVRNRGVVEAMGTQKELHKDLVQEGEDEGSGVAGRSREEEPQRRVATNQGFHRHFQFRIHQQAGPPLRDSNIAHRDGNAAYGAQGRAVVRDGRRRHRFCHRKPNSGFEKI